MHVIVEFLTYRYLANSRSKSTIRAASEATATESAIQCTCGATEEKNGFVGRNVWENESECSQ